MRDLKWSDISEYRGELFGLAIISIIIFHYFESVSAASYAGHTLKLLAKLYNGSVGSVGVDIFVILSGFGIYYALSKRPALKDFYRKRLNRVIIPYCILGGLFWVVKDLLRNQGVWKFFYDYSLLSFWGRGVRTFWYISCISVLYLVAPLAFLKRRTTVLFCYGFFILISVAIFFLSGECFGNIEIAVLRMPWFFAGMYCGGLSQDGTVLSKGVLPVAVVSVPVKIVAGVAGFPFARLLNGWYAGFLVLMYILLRKTVYKKEYCFFRLLRAAGEISLELYIVHVAFRNLMGTYGMKIADIRVYLVCIALSIPVAILFAKKRFGIKV